MTRRLSGRRRGKRGAAGPACSHLVVFGGGDEEEDGGDRVEALEPAPPLRPLPADVHHLEGNVLDLKVILVDALGRLTGEQDVLLGGEIILRERRKHATDQYLRVEKTNVRKNTVCQQTHDEDRLQLSFVQTIYTKKVDTW